MLQSEESILHIIKKDKIMMEIIKATSTLNLPDWWICAGFVRSKIWDFLHGFNERTSIPDVDVIYFDPTRIDEKYEKELEKKLFYLMPAIPWSVKNQARMHIVNNLPPYRSSEDAISKFPETATALGVMLDNANNLVLTAPCGIDDVINLVLKPTPYFTETNERVAIYEARIGNKNWQSIWNKLKVHPIKNSN